MVVVYYVNTYYLDAAIETIQAIKKDVRLHVLIEISTESKKTNIIDVESIDGFHSIEAPEKVLGQKKWKQLEAYFEGVASVRFVVYKSRKSVSLASLRVAAVAGKYINNLKPDVVQLDSVSTRIIGLYPLLRRKKVFITVHDPVPHSGEGSWKTSIVEFVFFRLAKGLFFYSNFASKQFGKYHPGVTAKRHLINFQPFTFIKQFARGSTAESRDILFFGRILIYKGVDLLLEAIPAILKKYPNEQFVIAGQLFNYKLDDQLLYRYRNNIRLLTGHLSTETLAQLIKKAKFIVCPYRDATQSGVLMTSYALGKMVVGSNVGAFPEYIQDNVNGILAEPDPVSIADKIIAALDNDRYKDLEKNISTGQSERINNYNRQCMFAAYLAGSC